MSRIMVRTEALIQARVYKGLTQKELASRIGVSPAYISLIERGEKSVGPATAKRICETLDLQWQQLFSLNSTTPQN
ncbi:helix-turn-helix transcriptional regulator [Marinicrinis lubricantis]|uniref:Helix-turn-helix transcriptional regulator n=1 Tax=Marinicrinis lubricantis TaxID=2086470 RepID=A0ABW1IT96_9BACL